MTSPGSLLAEMLTTDDAKERERLRVKLEAETCRFLEVAGCEVHIQIGPIGRKAAP